MDVPIGSFVKVWDRLTPLQRGVVSQRLREGKTFAQIAADAGHTLTNVSNAFYAARRKAAKV